MFRLIAVVLALLVAAGCGHSIDEGRAALEADDLGTAYSIAEEGIENRPADPRAHLLYAEVLVEEGRHAEALLHARRGADPDVTGAEGPKLLGDLLVELDQHPVEAARAYHQAREVDSAAVGDYSWVQALKAVVETPLGVWKADDQVWAMLEIRDVEPDHELVTPQRVFERRLVAARAAAAEQRVQRGIEHLEEAYGEVSGETDLFVEIGAFYLRADDPESALEVWSRLFEKAAEDWNRLEYYAAVGRRAIAAGYLKLAARLWGVAMGQRDDDQFPTLESPGYADWIPSLAAVLELTLDRPDGAYEMRRFALEDQRQRRSGERPVSTGTNIRFSGMFEFFGHDDYVRRHLELVAKETRPGPEIVERLVTRQLEVDDEEEARWLLERYVGDAQKVIEERSMKHVPLRSVYRPHLESARLAAESGRLEWARDFFEAARDIAQSDIVLHEELRESELEEYAGVLARLGDDKRLREVVDDFVAMEEDQRDGFPDVVPPVGGVKARAGRWLQEAGLYDEALEYARRGIDKEVNATTVERLAAIEYDRGDHDDALDTWLEAIIDSSDLSAAMREKAGGFFVERDDSGRAIQLQETLARSGFDAGWLEAARLELGRGETEAATDALEAFVDGVDQPRDFDEIQPRLVAILEALPGIESDKENRQVYERLEDVRTATTEIAEDGAAAGHLELSRIYVEHRRVGRAFAVLDDYIGAAEIEDRAKERLSREAVDRPVDQLEFRVAVAYFEQRREAGDSSPSLLWNIARTYDRHASGRRIRGQKSPHFRGDGDRLAAAMYDRFLDESRGQTFVDETERSWNTVAAALSGMYYWEGAWRAFRRGAQADDDRYRRLPSELAVAAHVADAKRIDKRIEDIVVGHTTASDSTTINEAMIRNVMRAGRLDAAQRLLEVRAPDQVDGSVESREAFELRLDIESRRQDPEGIREAVDEYRPVVDQSYLRELVDGRLARVGFVDELTERWRTEAREVAGAEGPKLMELGRISALAGDVQRADRLLARASMSPTGMHDDWMDVARIWEAAGRADRADRAWEMAILSSAESGGDPRIRAGYTAYLVRSGEIAVAMQAYRYCRDFVPECPDELADRLVPALQSVGHEDRARTVTGELVRHPNLSEAVGEQLIGDFPSLDEETGRRLVARARQVVTEGSRRAASVGQTPQLAEPLLSHRRVADDYDELDLEEGRPSTGEVVEFLDEVDPEESRAERISEFVDRYQDRQTARYRLVDVLLDDNRVDDALVVGQKAVDDLADYHNLVLALQAAIEAGNLERAERFWVELRPIAAVLKDLEAVRDFQVQFQRARDGDFDGEPGVFVEHLRRLVDVD